MKNDLGFPWVGLGAKLSPKATPHEIAKKAGIGWDVIKSPLSTTFKKKTVVIPGQSALLRATDGHVLDTVGADWCEFQNSEALELFHSFVKQGGSGFEMKYAGSLREGKIIWVLAKTNHAFTVSPREQIDIYVLFSNRHQYGQSANLMVLPVRETNKSMFHGRDLNIRIQHHRKFSPGEMKEALGKLDQITESYAITSKVLATTECSTTDYERYIRAVFPVTGVQKKERGDCSRAAQTAKNILHSHDGAAQNPNSWWNAYNSVTLAVDHLLGRSDENRLYSVWYGRDGRRKDMAFGLANDCAGR